MEARVPRQQCHNADEERMKQATKTKTTVKIAAGRRTKKNARRTNPDAEQLPREFLKLWTDLLPSIHSPRGSPEYIGAVLRAQGHLKESQKETEEKPVESQMEADGKLKES